MRTISSSREPSSVEKLVNKRLLTRQCAGIIKVDDAGFVCAAYDTHVVYLCEGKMFQKSIAAAAALAAIMSGANATVVTYSDQAAFEAAAPEGVTIIDTSESIGKTTGELSAETPGAEFFGPSSYVRSDGALLNGQYFLGAATPSLGLNFADGVNAVGVSTHNIADGGRILAYSGLNGTGTLLGEADFGGSSIFGGLRSTDLIMSVLFTCEFNYDLACGLNDPVFSVSAGVSPSEVPLPAAAWLFMAGAGFLGAVRRRGKA